MMSYVRAGNMKDRIECIVYAYALTSQTPPVTAARGPVVNGKNEAVRCQHTVERHLKGSRLLPQESPSGVCVVC